MTATRLPAATAPAQRLRVAIVQNGGMLAGAERWQLQLAGATERLDFRLIALGDGDTTSSWKARGARVTLIATPRRPIGIVAAGARIWEDLRADRPDVVVAHGVKAALAAVPAARALGIPVVWVRHDPSFTGRITDLLDWLSTGQVATAGWLLEGSRARDSRVLLPPRMPAGLDRDAARARLGLDADGPWSSVWAADSIRTKVSTTPSAGWPIPGAAAWSLAIAGIVDPSAPGRDGAPARALGVARRDGPGDLPGQRPRPGRSDRGLRRSRAADQADGEDGPRGIWHGGARGDDERGPGGRRPARERADRGLWRRRRPGRGRGGRCCTRPADRRRLPPWAAAARPRGSPSSTRTHRRSRTRWPRTSPSSRTDPAPASARSR